MATFHATFSVLLQRIGTFVSSETPSPRGPRQHGHSPAQAAAANSQLSRQAVLMMAPRRVANLPFGRNTFGAFARPASSQTARAAPETAGLGKNPIHGVGAAEMAWRIMAAGAVEVNTGTPPLHAATAPPATMAIRLAVSSRGRIEVGA